MCNLNSLSYPCQQCLCVDKNEHLKCVLTPYGNQKSSEVDGMIIFIVAYSLFCVCGRAGQYGAVSALDIGHSGERLLVGYARGLVSGE